MPDVAKSNSGSNAPPLATEVAARTAWLLFLASFLALYFELIVIRYISSEIRIFAYLKNLPLIASFLGLGVGMMLGRPASRWRQAFPFLAALIFLAAAYAPALHLTHIPFPNADYFVWGTTQQGISPFLEALRYFITVSAITAVIVAFFVVPGGFVGEHLAALPPLRGYGINLAGSFVGIAVFTLLSFLKTPPLIWLLIGFVLCAFFFRKEPLALVIFAVILVATGWPRPNNYWSPYYHLTLEQEPPPPGWPRPAGYSLSVNYDYHQKMVDLSPEFVGRYPDLEPYKSALVTYNLPYRFAKANPEVLIAGSGTGNDVAAALRNGATHVDAVEIDPVILSLGRKYHPEQPYASPRVTAHLGDARAFFKQAISQGKKYDLIIFGYLDSHTLLTSFSSVRLDNYVYTVESFEEAHSLLRENGTVVLAFASGASFITDRLDAMLTRSFGVAPRVYQTGYDRDGVVFVEGAQPQSAAPGNLPEIGAQTSSRASHATLATDNWPFLYLAGHTLPWSILGVLILFLWGCEGFLRRMKVLSRMRGRESLHFFFLGAGFLLLETKAVTELSLLFGSTWIVNAMVIGTFLAAGFLANSLMMLRPNLGRLPYVALFICLAVGLFVSCSRLDGLSTPAKLLGAAVLAGLPVFFSGMVFSSSFAAAERPSELLGMNLLGAVFGGALENVVMFSGVHFLGYLALLIYGASAVCAGTKSLEEKRPPSHQLAPVGE